MEREPKMETDGWPRRPPSLRAGNCCYDCPKTTFAVANWSVIDPSSSLSPRAMAAAYSHRDGSASRRKYSEGKAWYQTMDSNSSEHGYGYGWSAYLTSHELESSRVSHQP